MKALKNFAVILTIFFGLILFGTCMLNENPPDYIKTVAAYKEGSDGIVVYFVLSDSSGQMTTANGSVEIIISETVKTRNSEREREIYSKTFNVTTTSFQKTEVGQGAFKRKAILYSLGRIPYSRFTLTPSETMGKVSIKFTSIAYGKILTGEDTFFW